jgi:hypothetical protein
MFHWVTASPNGRADEGKVREASAKNYHHRISTLSYCLYFFFFKFYIDISARQARRRESVNKMNVLYLPKNLNMKQEKSNLIYLYTRFGEILCRAFIFLFKIHPRPLWKSSSSLFFIWEWIQKDFMSTATKENQHSKNFPQKFSFFFSSFFNVAQYYSIYLACVYIIVSKGVVPGLVSHWRVAAAAVCWPLLAPTMLSLF